jgi:transcriptional regulator with XRE-family HTH domain
MGNMSTPQELEAALGDNLKALRLQKNLNRQMLCERAGISENALRHLEGGKGATLKTLIRVVRAGGSVKLIYKNYLLYWIF